MAPSRPDGGAVVHLIVRRWGIRRRCGGGPAARSATRVRTMRML
jgi:hypothetical protein